MDHRRSSNAPVVPTAALVTALAGVTPRFAHAQADSAPTAPTAADLGARHRIGVDIGVGVGVIGDA